MEINCDTIKHLANLSNFSVSDTESKSLEKDLSEILKYISQLEEIDVKNVEPTYQVFEMENVWRNDEILEQDATREELLALTREQKDNQIKVPKVL
jgi:aspartyl-tRNA(Asn)/glutamyl-tRNA(Gln) amidotransferase subunit C